MEIGKQIVLEARTCLGTPFHHQGRLKGVGIDCFGLIINVLKAVGSLVKDSSSYGRYPTPENSRTLIGRLSEYFTQVPKKEMRSGDILVFWVLQKGLPQHLAIKTDVGMIHAFAKGRQKVTEHSIDEKWGKRLTHVFRFMEKT